MDTVGIGMIGSGFMGLTYSEVVSNHAKGCRLAAITGGSVATTGAVTLRATDNTTITADGGGISIALAPGAGGVGAAPSIGAGLADNDITSSVKAAISGTTLGSATQRTGAVTLDAESNAEIKALAFAGAVAAAGGTSASSRSNDSSMATPASTRAAETTSVSMPRARA